MEVNVTKRLESKIVGAVYGFVIGDAMGATTEFMTEQQIKIKYGKVDDLIGGGWLRKKPGQPTDDTEMMLCVMEALQSSQLNRSKFNDDVKNNFIKWYMNRPPDVGKQCAIGITSLIRKETSQIIDDNQLGNGSLMRALPCALVKREDLNLIQAGLTHPQTLCQEMVRLYHNEIASLVFKNQPIMLWEVFGLQSPTGCVTNTINNAMFWGQSKTFHDGIIGAVNHGGDSDTIAAIAGGILGARFGVNAIPGKWFEKLSKQIVDATNQFASFALDQYMEDLDIGDFKNISKTC